MTNTTTNPDNLPALALPEGTALVALFKTENGLDPLIERIAAEVRAHKPDLTTAKGRDAIKSLAYKVARSKTMLDDAGKLLTDEQRKQISVVDAARRSMREKLDALRDEARKPLDDWEADEETRHATLRARIKHLTDAVPAEDTQDAYTALITRVEAVNPEDGTWDEYLLDATKAKDATLRRLRDAAELFRLRAEAAARAEADRIAQEAAAAAEAERLEREAEAERQRQAEAAEAERQRVEAERAAQVEAERAEAAAKATRDAEQRAAEQAEKDRQAAAQREADLQAQLDAQRAETERAAQAERDRLAEQQRAAKDAADKRAADASHRQRIRDDIATSMNGFTDEQTAALIAEAIMGDKIPHVKAVL